VPSEAFSLSLEEAQALARTLEPLLEGRFALQVLRPDCWCLRGDDVMGAGTHPPIELAGADVDSNLPDKRWHPLLTEIQMALYDQAANTAREARGEPVVNSVWLWGGGKLPASAKGPWHSVSADSPVALGLARLAQTRHRAPGEGAAWCGTNTAEWTEGEPPAPMPRHAVLMGDFNFPPHSPLYPKIVGPLSELYGRCNHLEGFVDAWVAAGHKENEGVTCEDARINYSERIDFCFVSSAIAGRVKRAWIDNEAQGSDHQPIWTELG